MKWTMYSCWGHAATEKAKDLLDAFYKQHYLYASVTLVSLQGKLHRVIMTLRFFSSEMQLSTHFLAWSFTTEKKNPRPFIPTELHFFQTVPSKCQDHSHFHNPSTLVEQKRCGVPVDIKLNTSQLHNLVVKKAKEILVNLEYLSTIQVARI